MGNVVGIDLGTTNSVAAFKFAEVEVASAPDNSPPERKLTRSVVALTQGKIVVGEEGYRQLKGDPENVIASIKRLMGRGFGDKIVQEQLSRFNYKISKPSLGTENGLSVWLGGKEYEPEDISGEILKKVVQNAQNYQTMLGQKGQITHAVITIPAYFNDKQRHATQIAAKRAGLVLSELLPEPTAAAISYGFKPDSEEVQTILVYDFGGGTFDCSLITVAGNQFVESGKAGDLWLGGDDIDTRLTALVKQKVAEVEGLDDIDGLIAKMPHYQKVRLLGDLKMAVEKAKIDLSSRNSAKVLPSTPLLDEMGMTIDINVEITREELEEIITPLIDRSLQICYDALNLSQYTPDMVDVVLLVGGSSQIPLVQRRVREAFGNDKVVVHPRPMYAVAEGAAIVAAGLTDKVTTVSRDYFIELVDEPRYPIIHQGDILPVTKSHTFRTEADGQRLIHFKFYSGDQVRESLDGIVQDERIGDMWLAFNQAYPKRTEVLVTAELDEQNNSLKIMAALKNDPSIRVSCSFSRGGVDENISRKVEERIKELNEGANLTEIGVQKVNELAGEIVRAANQIQQEDGKIQGDRLHIAQQKLQELQLFANTDVSRARGFINDFEFALKECASQLQQEQKQRLQELIINLQDAINTGNVSALQKFNEDAKREFENLPDVVSWIIAFRGLLGEVNRINPTHANALAAKLSHVVYALQVGDSPEAHKLLEEISTEIQPYLDSESSRNVNSIATGITR